MNEDLALFARSVVGESAKYSDSLLFRAGTFPERIVNGKPLTITRSNLHQAVKNFNTPVPGNILHSDYLEDIGHIVSMYVDGDELRGDVLIDLWFDEGLTKKGKTKERQISVEWNPISYDSLKGFALCTRPRIAGASLNMSELEDMKVEYFAAKHTTYHGQSAMQHLHDTAARAGAICEKPDKDDGKMISKPEAKAFQTIHDHAVANGASCNSPMYYTDDPHNRTTCHTQPAEEVPRVNPHLENSTVLKKSDIWSSVVALFTSKGIEVEDDTVTDPSGVVHQLVPITAEFVKQDVTKSAEFIAEQTKANELADKLKKFEDEASAKFTADNEAAVDAVIAVGKFEVNEREGLLVKRAGNPALFDEMVNLVPIKPEFAPVTVPGTVDAQAVAAALDKKPTDTSLDATKSALNFHGLSPKL